MMSRNMATSLSFPVLVLSFLYVVLFSPSCHALSLQTCQFDAIYQLGESISDTGNLIRENPSSIFARLPYGESFFKNATGGCSNGLLMIDYLGNYPLFAFFFWAFAFLAFEESQSLFQLKVKKRFFLAKRKFLRQKQPQVYFF